MAPALKKILFVSQLPPYPISGGTWKSWNLIEGLLNEGFSVDVCCFQDPSLPSQEIKRKNLRVFSFQKKILHLHFVEIAIILFKSFFKLTPLRVLKFFDSDFLVKLKQLQKENMYEFYLFEVLSSLQYLPYLKNINKSIYIEQNIESNLVFRRRKTSSFPQNIFWFIEEKLTKKFERIYLKQVDKIFAISSEDKNKLFTSFNLSSSVLPICLPWVGKKYLSKKIKYLVFIGLLSWPENEQGLRWFLIKVWPKVKKDFPNSCLIVCGSNPSTALKLEIEQQGAEYKGFIENLDSFLEERQYDSIGVVPILSGSGIRIKILKLLQYGIPIISTSIGAEGIDRRLVEIADTNQEFVKKIRTMVLSSERRREKFHKIKKILSKDYNEQNLRSFLKRELV